MDEEEGAGRELKRALHDLAATQSGTVDHTPVSHLVGDEGVALVEGEQPELALSD